MKVIRSDKVKENLINGAIGLPVLLIIGIILIMMFIIVKQGIGNFTWEFLTSFPRDGMTKGGIFPAIYGTALMVIIMSIAAVPLGTITAIYLAEYASENS